MISQALESPYRGLKPFYEVEHRYFSGRENWCEAIIDNMIVSRLTVLCGASGVGKTSVLRAGVAHEFRERSKQDIAPYQLRPPTPKLAVVVFPPINNRSWRDDHPLHSLMLEINEQLTESIGLKNSEIPLNQDFISFLRGSTERIGGRYASGTLYVILDQFEQYLEYHPCEKNIISFAEEFPKAVQRLDLNVHFLIAIREDQLARLDRFSGSIPRLFDNLLRLKHLGKIAAEEAIRGPLLYWNKKKQTDIGIEEKLVEHILTKVERGNPSCYSENQYLGTTQAKNSDSVETKKTINSESADAKEIRIETAYLQLVMQELWKHRGSQDNLDMALLNKHGGVEGIIKSFVTNIMEERLSDRQRLAMSEAFYHLVTPGEIRISQTFSDLYDYINKNIKIDEKELKKALDDLVLERILNPTTHKHGNIKPDQEGYEIFHEVLAKPILGWIGKNKLKQRLRESALASSLAAQAIIQHTRWRQYELALWLALHAYEFNKTCDELFLSQVDHALRTVLSSPYFCHILKGHEQGVETLALSPDGKWLATGGFDSLLVLWDLHHNGKPLLLPKHDGPIWTVAFSPDSTKLASGGQDIRIRIFNITQSGEPKLLYTLNPKNKDAVVWSLAFNHDAQYLASGHGDKKIRLWKLGEDTSHSLQQLESNVKALTFSLEPLDPKAQSKDPNKLIAGVENGDLKLWWNPIVNTQENIKPWDFPVNVERGITSVACSSLINNKQFIAYSNESGWIWFRDVYKFDDNVKKFKVKTKVRSISINQDGDQLAASREDGAVQLWNLEPLNQNPPRDPELAGELPGHSSWINSVAYGPEHLASGGIDGSVRLWELNLPEAQPKRLPGHERRVSTLAFRPDGKRLASGSSDEKDPKVFLWDMEVKQPNPILIYDGHTQGIGGVAFSADQRWFAFCGHDHQVRLGTQQGQNLRPIYEHSNVVSALAFSPGSSETPCIWLASGSPDGEIKLWNLKDERVVAKLKAGSGIKSIAFGGSILIAACDKGGIYLWENPFDDPKPKPVIPKKPDDVKAFALSDDGEWLAYGGKSGKVYLLELSKWRKDRQSKPECLHGHETCVTALAFSRDGESLASGGDDHVICLWNLRNPKAFPVILSGHEAAVHSLAFHPDGIHLASGGDDNVIRLWIARTEELVKIARNKIWRDDLSKEEWLRFVGDDILPVEAESKEDFGLHNPPTGGSDE
ncbi:MAG: WD40 repeat domain-containing protein [Candidatus Methylumidiphilus sp.]